MASSIIVTHLGTFVTRWDQKDGKLCLSRAKSEGTLMAATLLSFEYISLKQK